MFFINMLYKNCIIFFDYEVILNNTPSERLSNNKIIGYLICWIFFDNLSLILDKLLFNMIVLFTSFTNI